MTTFTEKTLTNLFEGALDVDGDTISIYRINGAIPPSWPHSVDLPQGSVNLAQDGTITYDDGLGAGGAASGPPNLVPNGSFTYTLWDDQDESEAYTATVTLEEGGFTSTAPAKPAVLTTSAEQAASFDVTLPADPDDGGVAITKRVLSIMPEADFNAGNYANAVYHNNFSAQETRTIDAGSYGAISSSQTHILRWKALNSSTDNNGHGPYCDPVTVTLAVQSNAPSFTTQPSLTGAPFSVGDTVALNLGAGTGDNAVTATVEYFRLGSVSKVGALSGLNWNSAGSQPGILYFRVRLTDDVSGLSTLSNEITTNLSAATGSTSVKDQVIALFGTSGRNSANALQTLTSANAPAGVNFGATAKGVKYAQISAAGVVLQDFLIDSRTIFLNAHNVTIRNCEFTEGTLAGDGGDRYIDIKNGMNNFVIEDNNFSGKQGLGNGIGAFIFQRPTAGTGGIIRRNRSRWFGQDAFKISGGVLMEENVFYAPSNLTTLPLGPYNSNYTYQQGDVIQSGLKHYVSLANNNQGNPLNDGSKWGYRDPHYDTVNAFENTSPSTIRRNLFLLDPQDPMIPAAERSHAVGCNSALWIVRNQSTANSTSYQQMVIEENVLLKFNTYFGNPPIGISSSGGGVWVKPDFIGNYVDDNIQGLYATPTTASSANWGVNYDATSGATISP